MIPSAWRRLGQLEQSVHANNRRIDWAVRGENGPHRPRSRRRRPGGAHVPQAGFTRRRRGERLTFSTRRLDGWHAPATGSSPGLHALLMSAADVGALREAGDPTQNGWSPASSTTSGVGAATAFDRASGISPVRPRAHSRATSKRAAYASRFATFRRATGTTSPEPAVRIC